MSHVTAHPLLFNIINLKRCFQGAENVQRTCIFNLNVNLTKERFSCVWCAEREDRRGVVFSFSDWRCCQMLWTSVLLFSCDLPKRAIYLCTLASGLQTCLSAQCSALALNRRAFSSVPDPVNKNYPKSRFQEVCEVTRWVKSRCAPCIFET